MPYPDRFYPVVDSVAWVARLALLGVGTIQLRAKNLSDGEALQIVTDALDVIKGTNARLVVNDYWRAAIVAGSWALALAWGSVLGSVLAGGGLGVGSVAGLPLAVLFAWHGAGFVRWRLPVGLAERAGRVPSRYGLSALVMAGAPVVAGVQVEWSEVVAEGAGLTMTVVVTVVVLPLLLASQALVWWTFRGRVESPSYL